MEGVTCLSVQVPPDDIWVLILSDSVTVVLTGVSLFCSASGPERDSSGHDGPCLTGKFSVTALT